LIKPAHMIPDRFPASFYRWVIPGHNTEIKLLFWKVTG
jgi:hypothetical protein